MIHHMEALKVLTWNNHSHAYHLAGLVPVACGVPSAPPSPAALPAQQLPPPHHH